MALAILEAAGTITEANLPDGGKLSEGAIAAGYQNFLICCEMLLGSSIMTLNDLLTSNDVNSDLE